MPTAESAPRPASLPATLAQVAGILGPAHVSAWARVLATLDQPGDDLPALLLAAAPGDGLGRLAHDLLSTWRAATPAPDGRAVSLALLAAAAQMDRLDRAHRVDLVVSGPRSRHVPVRATGEVANQLIRGATASLLVVTYAATDVAELRESLGLALTRGVSVDVVAETRRTGAADEFAGLLGARVWHWPTAGRPPHAAMHAKLLVADRRVMLLGSANLTGSAMTGNIEVGLVVHDQEQVGCLVDHFRALMTPDAGVLLRYQL